MWTNKEVVLRNIYLNRFGVARLKANFGLNNIQ